MKELTKEIIYDGQNVRALVGYLIKVREELYSHPDFDEEFNGKDFVQDLMHSAQLIDNSDI